MTRLALLAACLTGALAPALAAQTSTHRLAGPEIAVYDLVGQISVVPGAGPDVVVEATRTGRDAARISVATDPIRGVPSLRVDFPGEEIVYPALGRHSRSTFSIRSDGTWGDRWRGHGHRDRDSREITVRGDGSGLEAAANLRISIPAGKRVAIHLGTGQMDASNVAGILHLDAMSGDVRVTGGSGQLNVDTGSGDITVTGTDGDLDLDTGSGKVTVQRARGRSLRIDTGSGSVSGSELRFDTANVDAGSGDILLDGLTGSSVKLETGSGDVEVTLTQTPDRLTVSTGSGAVRVRLPDNPSATIDLESGSGGFDVDFPLQLVRKDEDSLTGRIGDGKGRISIETGSGDITISQ